MMHLYKFRIMTTLKIKTVLILVVMDNALVLLGKKSVENSFCIGLNPCCNG